jgi:hypothetical protein
MIFCDNQLNTKNGNIRGHHGDVASNHTQRCCMQSPDISVPAQPLNYETLPALPQDAVILVDASGSMKDRVAIAVDALNRDILPFLRQQSGTFSLVLFNTTTQRVLWRIPLSDTPEISSFPVGGGTYLFDAILVTLADAFSRNPSGSFVIVTDGDDRGSSGTAIMVRDLFARARLAGWTIRVVEVDVQFAHLFGATENEIIRAKGHDHDSFRAAMTQATRHMTRIPQTADFEVIDRRCSHQMEYQEQVNDTTKRSIKRRILSRHLLTNLCHRFFLWTLRRTRR